LSARSDHAAPAHHTAALAGHLIDQTTLTRLISD